MAAAEGHAASTAAGGGQEPPRVKLPPREGGELPAASAPWRPAQESAAAASRRPAPSPEGRPVASFTSGAGRRLSLASRLAYALSLPHPYLRTGRVQRREGWRCSSLAEMREVESPMCHSRLPQGWSGWGSRSPWGEGI